MKLSEKIKDMHERMTAPNIAELAVGDWIKEATRLEARIKALEASVSKSVLRRLDAQLKED